MIRYGHLWKMSRSFSSHQSPWTASSTSVLLPVAALSQECFQNFRLYWLFMIWREFKKISRWKLLPPFNLIEISLTYRPALLFFCLDVKGLDTAEDTWLKWGIRQSSYCKATLSLCVGADTPSSKLIHDKCSYFRSDSI